MIIKNQKPEEILFSELKLKHIILKNRLIRSATYEGMADKDGYPSIKLADIYLKLAENDVGTIITGFCYVSKEGKAMHPRQIGIDEDSKIEPWKEIVSKVKNKVPSVKLFMQIAHAGRQTTKEATKSKVVAPSNKKCSYFKEKPEILENNEILSIIEDFRNSAVRAKKAGFDGIQIHSAHGYLIHQFLSPYLNNRKDIWGKDRFEFLRRIILSIKSSCGENYPIILKISAEDDNPLGIKISDTIAYLKEVEKLNIDAVEISYGTMEFALNIIRGDIPLNCIFRINPFFKNKPQLTKKLWKLFVFPRYKRSLIPFTENYNLDYAKRIKEEISLPIFLVGGLRNVDSMKKILTMDKIDAISMCRPFICEPDFASKIRNHETKISKCKNCNMCTIMVDSLNSLKCWKYS